MQKLYLFLCVVACIIFGSCSFTKWDNYEELVGEWESPWDFYKGAKFIFNEDGTCQVIDVPIRGEKLNPFGDPFYTLFWKGSKKFKEELPQHDKWNFSGYWTVKEYTSNCIFEKPYQYWIVMSPYREMLGTNQECDSFISNNNAEDVFYVSIEAWTESFFPPACLHYLYFYAEDPNNSYDFFRVKKE